jgi:arylsulfatase A-like enzyme
MKASKLLFTSKHFLFFLLLGFFLTSCNYQTGQEAKKPNILFIAVDDLRPELGCYGVEYAITPNINRLAGNGIMFTNAFCQSAVCNPSRASLLTGLRPNTNKVWDLWTDLRSTVPDVVTLPQYFKNNGYYTNAIGKIYHNTMPDTLSWSEDKLHVDGYPFDPDATYVGEEALQYLEARKAELLAEGKEGRYIDRIGEWYLKAYSTECEDVPDNAYFDGAQTDLALEKLEEYSKKDQPFFFAIGYYRPHLPFNAPKKYWDMYDPEAIPMAENDFIPEGAPPMAINNFRELRGYADFKDQPSPLVKKLTVEQAKHLKHGYMASVSYVDAQVGRLLDKLDELGLSDNTIIVLWGDHGWKLGEHGSWCKMTNYTIDTRVPLIFSTPDLRNKPVICDELVEFVDVYPTLCDLAGIAVPENLEGISSVPLFSEPWKPWKKAVFSQFLRSRIWLAPDGIPYHGYSIRTREYLYVEWINVNTGELAATELYDLKKDPQENKNLVTDPAYDDVAEILSGRLERGWHAAIPR